MGVVQIDKEIIYVSHVLSVVRLGRLARNFSYELSPKVKPSVTHYSTIRKLFFSRFDLLKLFFTFKICTSHWIKFQRFYKIRYTLNAIPFEGFRHRNNFHSKIFSTR